LGPRILNEFFVKVSLGNATARNISFTTYEPGLVFKGWIIRITRVTICGRQRSSQLDRMSIQGTPALVLSSFPLSTLLRFAQSKGTLPDASIFDNNRHRRGWNTPCYLKDEMTSSRLPLLRRHIAKYSLPRECLQCNQAIGGRLFHTDTQVAQSGSLGIALRRADLVT
jgi:hypothetical protein